YSQHKSKEVKRTKMKRPFNQTILAIAVLALCAIGANAQYRSYPFVQRTYQGGFRSSIGALGAGAPIAINSQVVYAPYGYSPYYGAFGAPVVPQIIYSGYNQYAEYGYRNPAWYPGGYWYGYDPLYGYAAFNADYDRNASVSSYFAAQPDILPRAADLITVRN